MENQEENYATVEAWKVKHHTKPAVFEGTLAANGWKRGKTVDEKAYLKAVADFEAAPMDGREVKQDVQQD